MKKVLVTGSLAFDFIMDFNGYFKDHILPDQLHILNVSFTAEKMTRNFGGTAGNIAYTLALLGEKPLVFSTVGKDFAEYRDWLDQQGVDTSEIVSLPDTLTASAHIITDRDANQITAFHGGAMLQNNIPITPVIQKRHPDLAILAASGREGMLLWAREFRQQQLRYIYDPGQSLPAFNGEELCELARGAYLIILNHYEEQLFRDKTGLTAEQFYSLAPYVVVTCGAEGARIFHQGKQWQIPAAHPHQVVDPTGAGDAFRAGLLKGLLHDAPMATAARIGALTGCYAVEHHGTQNHRYTLAEFCRRYQENFDENLSWGSKQ